MDIRKCRLTLLAAAIFTFLAGCGKSTLNIQNPAAPPSSTISIAFQPAPAGSISLSATAPITAVVNGDASDAGVDWSLLCQTNANCGALYPLHTASGTPATYTPPANISGNTQTFTIEAFATADHNKNVITPVTVTGFAGNLKGTYVYETRGEDANGPFQLAGVIVLDGNGGITSGEQTHNDPSLSVSDAVTGGSYNIGPDGRGTLTINTADINIGQQGVENLTLAFVSNSQALIATLDNPNLPLSNETSSGTLDLQSSVTAPTAAYAFAVSGTDLAAQPMSMGGVFNIDAGNAISGSGSVADQDDAGTLFPSATLSGALTKPDSFGSLKLSLTAGFAASPIQFTAYIVDGTHMKLIESDNNGTGAGLGSTAGIAIGQGAATGKFNNQAFSGNYVLGVSGQDLSAAPTSLAAVERFTADTQGNMSNGYGDEYLAGLGIEISDSFTGTYTLDSAGIGRVDSFITFSSNGPGPEFIFYLTGNGNPPVVLDADANSGSLGTGLAYPQAVSSSTFSGRYALAFTQNSAGLENDATGQITVNATSNTLSGFIDTNLAFSTQPDTQITGNFVPFAANGPSAGSLANTFFPSPGNVPNTLAVAFYLVDSNHGLFIETDSLISGELSLGYFASRTPVCPSCP